MQAQTFSINQEIPQTLSSQQSLIAKIQSLITNQIPQCSFSNKAIYICINKNCLKPSPFVCISQECKCSQIHQLCPQIKLKSFAKIFDKKQKIKGQIQQKINDRTDNLIDDISDLRQRMIENIKQGQDEQIFINFQDKKISEKYQSLKELKQQHLTGQLMSSIYESDRNLQNSNKIQKILQKIDKIFDNVKSYVNTEFVKIGMTISKIQTNTFKLFWSPQLKGSSQQIKGKVVKKVGSISNRYTLLQPSLTQIIASKITWSVKILNINSWVGLGICFKNIVEKNKFDFINYTNAEHGGFIISSNGYTWAHNNLAQNSSQTHGITFSTGDTIDFEFNQTQSLLKYINKTTKKSGQLIYLPQNSMTEESIYICSCLGGVGDEIEMGIILADGIELEWAQKQF